MNIHLVLKSTSQWKHNPTECTARKQMKITREISNEGERRRAALRAYTTASLGSPPPASFFSRT